VNLFSSVEKLGEGG